MKVEYHGYVLEIIEEDNPSKLSFKCQEPNLKLFNGLRACITLESLVSSFKKEVDILLAKKEEQMKNMKVEYNGYTLEIEEVKDDKGNTEYYTANCAELPYFVSGIFKTDLAFIISYFKRTVHYYTFSELNKKEEENKDFEYKGYTLKLGVVETRKGGYCEELNYKTYGDDEEANITKFKKYINWKITSNRKEDSSHTHLLTQLDRLVQKDKENNFTPFELRGQLIGISHLFSKVLDITLEDIYKLYFERAEG